MVAKAATKSGEFFCFHCGKAANKQDTICKNCGVDFDRVIEAFRCPRCSNLLPLGAAACPSCNLGFKVKMVSGDKKMSEDDRFLIKLIEWGKQEQTSPPPQSAQPAIKTVRVAKTPPPPPPIGQTRSRPSPGTQQRQPVVAKPEPKIKIVSRTDIPTQTIDKKMDDRKRVLSPATRVEEKTMEITSHPEVKNLYAQLEEEMKEKDRLEQEIRELRSMMQKQKATVSESVGADTSLSMQSLKKLLEERDKEIKELKEREEELARKEEHLNRKIRSYAVKMKELESVKKNIEDTSENKDGFIENQQISTDQIDAEFVEDEREDWMKDQSRIKAGLIEIRNQLMPKKQSPQNGYYQGQIPGDVVEKIEVLEEKLADISKERDDLHEQIRKVEETRQDVAKLLKVLDQLLGKLPPEVIDEFSKSENYKQYEKVLDQLNI